MGAKVLYLVRESRRAQRRGFPLLLVGATWAVTLALVIALLGFNVELATVALVVLVALVGRLTRRLGGRN